jgi:hypothetical protein
LTSSGRAAQREHDAVILDSSGGRLRKAESTKVQAVAMDETGRINNIAGVLEFLGLMQ